MAQDVVAHLTLTPTHANDVYRDYIGHLRNGRVKVTKISPPSEKHIAKYSQQKVRRVKG